MTLLLLAVLVLAALAAGRRPWRWWRAT